MTTRRAPLHDLHPVADGLLYAAVGAVAGGVPAIFLDALRPGPATPWVCALVCAGLAFVRSTPVQLRLGGGRLDNRAPLRMLVGGAGFTAWLCTLGLPWLACAALAVTTVVHVGWSGHRAGRFGLLQGVVTVVLLQVAVHRGWVPSIVDPLTGDVIAAVELVFFAVLVVNVGLVTRDRERVEQALEDERGRHTRDLLHAATHDRLTGLLDRAEVVRRLEGALAHASPSAQIAVLFADLDGFKAVNDTHGHDGGDRAIVAVAARLRELVRDDEHVARLGGDEFLIVLTGLPGEEAARAAVTRVEDAVTARYDVGGAWAPLGVSIGLALAAAPVPAAALVAAADLAMYEVKDRRRPARAEARAVAAAPVPPS
ncbi:GGDEF domain-containing protein [Kineococcus rubinsiae]|uniref:GGDEF domain-containing protein n=1 Tax=Kineococcus rubinsiae TaxID=2609562 RepID=UPI001431454B|nr:GGDEF domain-containing protein [Kineococcus rubinsiae]